MMRAHILALSFGLLAIIGCGGPTVDEPAKLTPEQEQKILQQVEQATQEESTEASTETE